MAARLFVLYQNQLVEYIRTVQGEINADTYDRLRGLYSAYKGADEAGKKEQMLEFVNNLMDFDRAVIARDESIFATDDLVYGSYPQICLLPGIDFRPLARIHPDKMWAALQKMYVVAMRVLEEDPAYRGRIRRNLLNTLRDTLISDEAAFKSSDFVKRVWANFMKRLEENAELRAFVTKCTADLSIQDLHKHRAEIADAATAVIEIAAGVFRNDCADMNVYDLRDDFVTILERVEKLVSENGMMVRNGLKMVQNVEFFRDFVREFGQPRCTTPAELLALLAKVKTSARDITLDEATVREKVQTYLDLAVAKISRESVGSTIDQVARILSAILGKKL